MISLALLKAILAALSTVAVVVLVVLTLDHLVTWFQERERLKLQDKDNIAFTIQEKLAANEVTVVQGIFNMRTNTVLDSRRIQSQSMEDRVRDLHRGEALVVYE